MLFDTSHIKIWNVFVYLDFFLGVIFSILNFLT